ncbi:MAG: MarR family winged helix-turn-helix transcriptional regulator [Methylovirgula sp.]
MSKIQEPSFATTRDVRDHCLCLHILRAARVTARCYDEALRPVQLTNGQFSILMALNRPQPPSVGEVSDLLGMDRTTLTANLKPLARRGLVDVTVDSADKRSRRLLLTPEGRARLTDALPLWNEAQARMDASLKRTNPDRLRADLRALSSAEAEAGASRL